jgi:dihydroorotase-like cyclic amidohydrolase
VPESYTPIRFTDVLDPLTGERSDLGFDVPGPFTSGADSPVFDGSELWVLPGLYDADAHLPILQRGIRPTDQLRALAGGATALNTAVPWHLLEPLDLQTVTDFFAATAFPRMLPILSISDQPSSEGFAAWIDKFGAQLKATWMPTIKMYSNDPFFLQNLEAAWAAGFRAAIYFYDEKAFTDTVASRGGPVHFRHVISKEMADAVESRPDSTSQTSPHFLVELPAGRAEELFVLPPVPGGDARTSLRQIISTRVDLIASDHNAPIAGNKGPGLEIEQFLLPALLTLVEQGVLDLATALAKTTTDAVAVFQPAAEIPESTLIVDPISAGPVGLWPGQEARRSAFLGVELAGSVLAVASGGTGRFL